MEPGELVADIEAGLAPLEEAAARSWWDASVDASPQAEARRVEADQALGDFLAVPGPFAVLGRVTAGHGVGDETTARAARVLHDTFAPHQVPEDLRHRIVALQASVEGTFATHRGVVAGEEVDDNDISRILRTSDDVADRREAWESAKAVGSAVADRVRELARLRNEAARTLGHRDHFALALATAELDESRLLATLEAVDRATAAPFREWKRELDGRLATRFGCAVGELAPWHYDDPFFQSPPVSGAVDLDPVLADHDLVALARRTFAGLGLEVDDVLAHSDLAPRPGKNQHAFCIDLDRAGDVRVLANVEPNEQWADTMLHELGHAVYFTGVEPGLPWTLRTMHALTTEGVAMLCGRLVRDPEWLGRVAGLSPAEAEALVPGLRATQRAALLVFARWVLVMVGFERSLYADPEQDLDARWWELVARHQDLLPPPERPAGDWAAKIHVAAAPVYYQHYLYGELVASQLDAWLRGRHGGLVDRPEAGADLARAVFAPGAALRWDALVRTATGADLGTAAFAAELEAFPSTT